MIHGCVGFIIRFIAYLLTGWTLTSLNLSLVSSSIFKEEDSDNASFMESQGDIYITWDTGSTEFEKGSSYFYFRVNFKAQYEQLMLQ